MGKVKMVLKYARCKALYLFRPFHVIGICLCFMLVVVAGGLALLFHVQVKEIYDVLMALITGITASVIVAVIIEMTNNYQRNNKRWLLLSRLFETLSYYSSLMEIYTGKIDLNKAHIALVTSIHQNMVDEREESPEEAQIAIENAASVFLEGEDEEEWGHCDRVCSVFSHLPEIVPEIDDAYHNYEGNFNKHELESMAIILEKYKQIEKTVELELLKQSTLKFGLSPRDPGELVTWLPNRIKKDLSESVVLALAQEVWNSGRTQIANTLIKRGTSGLSSLGIELSDAYLDDGSGDEPTQEESEDSFPGNVISRLTAEIDHELISLQGIIKTEPGFSEIYEYMDAYNSRYRH